MSEFMTSCGHSIKDMCNKCNKVQVMEHDVTLEGVTGRPRYTLREQMRMHAPDAWRLLAGLMMALSFWSMLAGYVESPTLALIAVSAAILGGSRGRW